MKEVANAKVQTSNLNAEAKEDVVRRNEQMRNDIEAMQNQMDAEMEQLKKLPYSQRRQKVDHYRALIDRIRVKAGLENSRTLEDTAKQVSDISQKSEEKKTGIKDKYSQKQTKEKESAASKKSAIKQSAASRKSSLRSQANSQKTTLREQYKNKVYDEYTRINRKTKTPIKNSKKK